MQKMKRYMLSAFSTNVNYKMKLFYQSIAYNDGKYDLIVLLAKKSYCLFRMLQDIYSQDEKVSICRTTIITDEALPFYYADIKSKKIKKILLVDDILVHGSILMKYYTLLTNIMGKNDYVEIMVFAKTDNEESWIGELRDKNDIIKSYYVFNQNGWRELSYRIIDVIRCGGIYYKSALPSFTMDSKENGNTAETILLTMAERLFSCAEDKVTIANINLQVISRSDCYDAVLDITKLFPEYASLIYCAQLQLSCSDYASIGGFIRIYFCEMNKETMRNLFDSLIMCYFVKDREVINSLFNNIDDNEDNEAKAKCMMRFIEYILATVMLTRINNKLTDTVINIDHSDCAYAFCNQLEQIIKCADYNNTPDLSSVDISKISFDNDEGFLLKLLKSSYTDESNYSDIDMKDLLKAKSFRKMMEFFLSCGAYRESNEAKLLKGVSWHSIAEYSKLCISDIGVLITTCLNNGFATSKYEFSYLDGSEVIYKAFCSGEGSFAELFYLYPQILLAFSIFRNEKSLIKNDCKNLRDSFNELVKYLSEKDYLNNDDVSTMLRLTNNDNYFDYVTNIRTNMFPVELLYHEITQLSLAYLN